MLEHNQAMLEQNKALMKRFVEEVLNTGDVELVPKFIAPNHVNHNDPTQRSNGVAGMQKHIKVFRCTYPDVHVTVEGQVAEGDTVVSRLTYRGTHQGCWLGIKPTGKVMTMRGAKSLLFATALSRRAGASSTRWKPYAKSAP